MQSINVDDKEKMRNGAEPAKNIEAIEGMRLDTVESIGRRIEENIRDHEKVVKLIEKSKLKSNQISILVNKYNLAEILGSEDRYKLFALYMIRYHEENKDNPYGLIMHFCGC